MAVLKSKVTGYGLVEVRDVSTPGWYGLYVAGKLIDQSPNLNYILNQYDKY